jgi:Rieske Fe-S protein
MRRPSRRDFCVLTGAGVLAGACGNNNGGGGGPGSDAGARDLAVPSDLTVVAADLANPTCPVGTLVHVGPASQFSVGTATFFACSRIFICRDAAGLYALGSTCTHQGCDVEFNPTLEQFDCPCHQSIFDFNGAVLQSPALLPLAHFQLTVDANGDLVVDFSVRVDPSTRLGIQD